MTTTQNPSPEYQAYLEIAAAEENMTRDEYSAFVRSLNARPRRTPNVEVAIEAAPQPRYGNGSGRKAAKRTNRYAGRCHKCNGWIDAEAGLLVKVNGAWAVEHEGECPVAKPVPAPAVDGLNIAEIPAGRYAYQPEGGQAQFIVIQRPEEGKWDGYTFVKRQYSDNLEKAGYAKPNGAYRNGNATPALRAIMADPQAAMLLYGVLLGACGHCGRLLTNEESRERGIGPVCAAKLGW